MALLLLLSLGGSLLYFNQRGGEIREEKGVPATSGDTRLALGGNSSATVEKPDSVTEGNLSESVEKPDLETEGENSVTVEKLVAVNEGKDAVKEEAAKKGDGEKISEENVNPKKNEREETLGYKKTENPYNGETENGETQEEMLEKMHNPFI